MSYLVKSDLPPPAKPLRGARRYPFGRMDVGSSFFVHGLEHFRKAQQAASIYGKRNAMTFTTAREVSGGRIWRVS